MRISFARLQLVAIGTFSPAFTYTTDWIPTPVAARDLSMGMRTESESESVAEFEHEAAGRQMLWFDKLGAKFAASECL